MQTTMIVTTEVLVEHPSHIDPESAFTDSQPQFRTGKGCKVAFTNITHIEKGETTTPQPNQPHETRQRIAC